MTMGAEEKLELAARAEEFVRCECEKSELVCLVHQVPVLPVATTHRWDKTTREIVYLLFSGSSEQKIHAGEEGGDTVVMFV